MGRECGQPGDGRRGRDLLTYLSENGKEVTLDVNEEPTEGAAELTKTKTDPYGATYKIENLPDFGRETIWLCNVTKFVYGGEHPAKLYFKVVEKR